MIAAGDDWRPEIRKVLAPPPPASYEHRFSG
jgi:hypothetical protein